MERVICMITQITWNMIVPVLDRELESQELKSSRNEDIQGFEEGKYMSAKSRGIVCSF
jgi:hypothetical protein